MTRTLIGTVRVPPSRSIVRFWSTRSSLTCIDSGTSSMSSRKMRAAIGQLEASGPILDRTRERAALVTEELRLDQRFGEQRAAHRHERVVLAAARLVNQRRRHFLAGAALARDQHRAVAVADDAQELEHRAHPRAVADDERFGGRVSRSWPTSDHAQRVELRNRFAQRGFHAEIQGHVRAGAPGAHARELDICAIAR